jgi:hypothetical protein
MQAPVLDCAEQYSVKLFYHVTDNSMEPQYQIYNKLSYSKLLEFNDYEYIRQTSELLKYVDEGKFNLQDYCTIFHYVTRFGNPLNLDLNKLEKRFSQGIEKGEDNYTFVHDLNSFMTLDPKTEFIEHYESISNLILSTRPVILSGICTRL